jgi:hypothetical protein
VGQVLLPLLLALVVALGRRRGSARPLRATKIRGRRGTPAACAIFKRAADLELLGVPGVEQPAPREVVGQGLRAERAAAEERAARAGRGNRRTREPHGGCVVRAVEYSPGRPCHSTLSLTVIDGHSLRICTVILLSLLLFSVKMTVSPRASGIR